MITHLDKTLFAKHLAIMIKSGLPLRESILILSEQARTKGFQRVLENVLKQLDNGRSLAVSLKKHGRIFNPLFISMIEIGEASGTLEENLKHLALQLEKSHDLRRKVKAAMIYPCIILVSTIGLGTALSVFILPKLIPLFRALDVKLPLATKILLFIINLIQNYGIFIILGLASLIVISVLLSRLKPMKRCFHRFILVLPIVKSISRNVNLAYFSRTLATLLKSGIPIVNAMQITSGTLRNIIYQEALQKVSVFIQSGQVIGKNLKAPLFPKITSRMIGVGEKTGNLEESLFYLAQFYEKEVDNATKNLSIILEPILLVLIGLIVAFIAIAIITPIYQLTRGLRK